MSDDNKTSASFWLGKDIRIRAYGGYVNVSENGDVTTVDYSHATKLHVEQVSNPERLGQDPNAVLVAFRVDSTADRYLSMNMYGDQAKRAATEAIANRTPLLPVHVPAIVGYLVGEPSGEDNFEGAGFNYTPMTISTSPPSQPNMLQVFELEATGDDGIAKFGIKSLFGFYWRSQHWNNTISQSSHCLRDEHFYLEAFAASVPDYMEDDLADVWGSDNLFW